MTTNLKRYTIFSIMWSIVYFGALNWLLKTNGAEYTGIVAFVAVFYSLGFALMGHLLGKSDSTRDTRANLPLSYFRAACLSSWSVGTLWVLLFRQEEWRLPVIMAVVFGFFLTISTLNSRRTVKGISKDELFR
jgi:hypothetical protein